MTPDPQADRQTDVIASADLHRVEVIEPDFVILTGDVAPITAPTDEPTGRGG
jgi:hypothetical protein